MMLGLPFALIFLILLSQSEGFLTRKLYFKTNFIVMSVLDSAMHDEYDKLSESLVSKVMQLKDSQHWVGIAGGPGSGKSTLAVAVMMRVNDALGDELCVVLPMDGYHYSRQQLKDMAASGECSFDDLLARRGSPWTFDGEGFVAALTAAKARRAASLPVYSRKLSDPVPDGVQLRASHKIVLVEGNYLLNWEDPKWSGLREVFDERWFISCAHPEQQRQRLIKRHLETWTPEKERMWGVGEVGAAKKADSNDVLNAQFVDGHRKYADRIIISR